MKVKIFEEYGEEDLEKDINDFIEKEHMEVKDIKYSTTHYNHVYSFSALIMYEPKLEIFINQNIEGITVNKANYERYFEENVREDGTCECREIYKEVV